MAFSGCQHQPYYQQCFGPTYLKESRCHSSTDLRKCLSLCIKLCTSRTCQDWNFSPPHDEYPWCRFTNICLDCTKTTFKNKLTGPVRAPCHVVTRDCTSFNGAVTLIGTILEAKKLQDQYSSRWSLSIWICFCLKHCCI